MSYVCAWHDWGGKLRILSYDDVMDLAKQANDLENTGQEWKEPTREEFKLILDNMIRESKANENEVVLKLRLELQEMSKELKMLRNMVNSQIKEVV